MKKVNDIMKFRILFWAASAIVLGGIVFGGIILVLPVGSVASESPSPEAFAVAMRSYDEMIALLKWVGGIVVAGETSAIVFLIKALLSSHSLVVQEVRGAAERRETQLKLDEQRHFQNQQRFVGIEEAIREFQFRIWEEKRDKDGEESQQGAAKPDARP